MMKAKLTYLLGLIFCLGILSCEKKLNFESEVTTSKIVVNSAFSPEKQWNVNVSNSRSIIDTEELQPISDATVSIFKGGEFLENLIHQTEGIYIGSSDIESDQEYTVEVSAPNYEAVTSSSFAPSGHLEINAIDTTFVDSEYGNSIDLNFDLNVRDNQSGRNYYGVSLKADMRDVQSGSITHRSLYLSSSDIAFGASNDEKEYGEILIFNDLLMDQNNYNLSLEVQDIIYNFYQTIDSDGNSVLVPSEKLDKLYVTIYSYSRDLYLHNKSMKNYYEFNDDPFSQPTQVHTNIDGGFGIFAGYGIQEFVFEL